MTVGRVPLFFHAKKLKNPISPGVLIIPGNMTWEGGSCIEKSAGTGVLEGKSDLTVGDFYPMTTGRNSDVVWQRRRGALNYE